MVDKLETLISEKSGKLYIETLQTVHMNVFLCLPN